MTVLHKYVAAKIHGIIATDKSIEYQGSVSISTSLMEAAGILPYEEVQIVNLNNGARWTTYAIPLTDIPGEPREFTLNGGSARLGEIGDRHVIMTYVQSDEPVQAQWIHVNTRNEIASTGVYL